MSLKALSVLLGGAIGLALLAAAASRLVRSAERGNEDETQQLIADLLAETLHRRLGRSRAALLDVLRNGSSDQGLRERIDAALRSVELTFRRTGREDAEMRIDVRYEDDESYSATVERSWVELPARVREVFLRSGQGVFTEPWQTPWKAAR